MVCLFVYNFGKVDFDNSVFRIYKKFREAVLHPKSCLIFSTRFECTLTSSSLVSSVLRRLFHSFRVYFNIFPTRFECGFTKRVHTTSKVYNLKVRLGFHAGFHKFLDHSSKTEKNTLKTSGEDQTSEIINNKHFFKNIFRVFERIFFGCVAKSRILATYRSRWSVP